MRNLHDLLDRIRSCNQWVTGERRRGCQLPKQWSLLIPRTGEPQWSPGVCGVTSDHRGVWVTSDTISRHRGREEEWRQWYDRNMETRLTRGHSQDSGMSCILQTKDSWYPEGALCDFHKPVIVHLERFVTGKSVVYSHYSFETVCLRFFILSSGERFLGFIKLECITSGLLCRISMGSNFVVRLVYKGCKAAITPLQRAPESQSKDCFIHKPGARPGLTEDCDDGWWWCTGIWMIIILWCLNITCVEFM